MYIIINLDKLYYNKFILHLYLIMFSIIFSTLTYTRKSREKNWKKGQKYTKELKLMIDCLLIWIE
jgi:nicotinamide riboside transporter PnuC